MPQRRPDGSRCRAFLVAFVLFAATSACLGEPVSAILMIGDGMGAGQRTAAQWASAGMDGLLRMDLLPVQGWATTEPAFGTITDSAAAATAMATGTKTILGMVGLDPLLRRLPTLLEIARDAGWAVGLVTTTSITHATPAAFATHVVNRSLRALIAEQLIEADIDVLLGGGERDFLPDGTAGQWGHGSRLDGRNLLDEAAEQGAVVVRTPSEFAEFMQTNEPPWIRPPDLIGLFGHDSLSASCAPSLAEMTQAALTLLSRDPDGFFLMIEGGQIDFACHANDIVRTIETTLGFDKAVDVAASFVGRHPETLLVVTADHETGGLRVRHNVDGTGDVERLTTPEGKGFFASWETTGHTASAVPVSALGAGAERLFGTYENTWIFAAILQTLGLLATSDVAP